jgi:hypothetical protein
MVTYFHVKLLNDSLDKSTADIVPFKTPAGVVYSVYSNNPKMKVHLEKVLSFTSYIAAPGRNDDNFFADSVMELQPNSPYFMNAIPEILAWRGYDASVRTEVHKSLDFREFMVLDTIKSAAEGITYNPKGERIVKYVPMGYIAMHSDGRTLAGGKYLNANIDKEGTQWTLIKNPYESTTPSQRGQVKQFMDVGLEDYHPGVEEEIYQPVSEETPQPHRIEREFKREGPSLSEFYSEEKPVQKEELPKNFPAYLEPGNIVYSPQTGQAFDSGFWPPEGIDYESYDWYVFSGSKLSDKEKELYAPIVGLNPTLIPGVSAGIVNSEPGLDISLGFKLGMLDSSSGMMTLGDERSEGIKLNPVPAGKFNITDMLESSWKSLYRKASDVVGKIKELTRGKIDESLADMKIEGLRGSEAVFTADLYDYQKAVVLSLTQPEQYEVLGGPKGWHGVFLNIYMGLGKTAMVTAANAVMRNKGFIRNGVQSTVVTAPNKNIYVWREEIGKFLGENAIVIDGDRQTRINQWEEVLELSKTSELPPFIILGSSKFRMTRGDGDEDEDDVWELDTDAKYMQLLSLGGKYNGGDIAGNHVGIFIVDESGQYVNPDSGRHRALHAMIDTVYHGKGLTWTLNGTISGNSATDTISELSFVNKYVRDNYMALAQEYTKTNVDSTRETKALGRRVWKDVERTRDFFYTFGTQIYSLDTRHMDVGLVRTEDSLTPMGENWSSVYHEAERKMASALEEKTGARSMGLLSILINAGFGAVAPARLIEYDIGSSIIHKDMAAALSKEELHVYEEEYKNFVSQTTELIPGIGRVPIRGLTIDERNEIYSFSFSDKNKALLEEIVDAWECPYTDSLVKSIQMDFRQGVEAGRNYKVGVAGFSKISINKIARRLRSVMPSQRCLIQVIDGDVSPEEVSAMQTNHQNERDRNVVSLVTGAGAYGLSLPADRTYRSCMWNSAKGLQSEARFHRNPKQVNVTTVAFPEGISQYMRELELRKGSMANSATNVLLEVEDAEDEVVINTNSISKLLDKLAQYRPRTVGRGE